MAQKLLFTLLAFFSPWYNMGLPEDCSYGQLPGSELSVTLAIPCVSRHIQFLEGLFTDIVSQTLPPIEVVVALSEAAAGDETAIRESFHGTSSSSPNSSKEGISNLVVLATHEPRTHAANRNRAAAVATGDIISFMDADDRMHPDRLAVVACGLATTGANAFLHSFVLATADAQRYSLSDAWTSAAPANATNSAASSTPPETALSQSYECGAAPMVLGELIYDVYHSLPVGQAPAQGSLEEDGHGFAHVTQLPVEGIDASWKFAPHHGHISIWRHILSTCSSTSQQCAAGGDINHNENSRSICLEEAVQSTTRWVPGPGSNGEGEDVLYTNAILQRSGRANYSMAYSPRKLSLHLPTFARRCVALKADGSANALFDCTVSQDGTSVRFSGSTNLSPCIEEGHVQGLSYAEMVTVPGLLEKYAPWAVCIDKPAACRALEWQVSCFPFERHAELAPGVTYFKV